MLDILALNVYNNQYNKMRRRLKVNNPKKYNKLGVKLLASVLSVITLFPSASAANVEGKVGSENSVVRKIKDVGSRASLLAKRKLTKISTWIRNHPKTTIAIGTTIGLAIIGTVGFCYRSHKNRLAAEEEKRKAAEEAKRARQEEDKKEKARILAEEAAAAAKNKTKKTTTVQSEVTSEQAEKTDEPKPGEQLEDSSEETNESSKSLTDGESQLIEEPVKQPQPPKYKISPEELSEIKKNFTELSQEIGKAIETYGESKAPEAMSNCVECIEKLISDLEAGGLNNNVGGYFCQRYNDCFAALLKYDQEAKDGKNLSGKLGGYCDDLAKKYTALSGHKVYQRNQK